jgi:hypothetical protein
MLKPGKYTTLSSQLAAGTEATRKFVGEEGVYIRKRALWKPQTIERIGCGHESKTESQATK